MSKENCKFVSMNPYEVNDYLIDRQVRLYPLAVGCVVSLLGVLAYFLPYFSLQIVKTVLYIGFSIGILGWLFALGMYIADRIAMRKFSKRQMKIEKQNQRG